MKKLVGCVIAFFLSLNVALSDEISPLKAPDVFPSAIINSSKSDGDKLYIVFKTPQEIPDYFVTGDRVNKVFSVDSARLFKNNANLNQLNMVLPLSSITYSMNISRSEIERYYNVKFALLADNMDLWREQFIQQYDNKKSRAKFVEKFVAAKSTE